MLSSSRGGSPLEVPTKPSCGWCSPAVEKGNDAQPLPEMLVPKTGLPISDGSGKHAGRTDVGEFLGEGLGSEGRV